MLTKKYCVLLRGINVGGKNIIKMSDLKACFESMGCNNVSTYIQSGNVLFSTEEHDGNNLTQLIEQKLSDRFTYKSKIVLITYKQINTVVKKAPEMFGKYPEKYRYDVAFVKKPLTTREAIQNIKLREGVDSVFQGNKVLYLMRVTALAGKSYLSKIVSLPMYQNMTIRNWNTTTKLCSLMEQMI